MDSHLYYLISAAIAILGAYTGFIEKRLHDMFTNVQQLIDDKNKLNEVVQQNLKEDLNRIETKVDMLISLAIQKKDDT